MDSALQGRAWSSVYTRACDEWLIRIFPGQSGGRMALLGLGSYGQGEMSPHSDLDLMLVYERVPLKLVHKAADAIWYPIWDSGVRLDHSVKTPKEALDVAATDARALLGLLDARVVVGDANLGVRAIQGARAMAHKLPKELAEDLRNRVMLRHRDSGELAYLVEPNLKESEGGIRDFHIVRTLGDLAREDNLPSRQELDNANNLFLLVRTELHRVLQRPSDRLGLEEQDIIAPAAGFSSPEEMMKALSKAARSVSYALREILRQTPGASLAHGSRRSFRGESLRGSDGSMVETVVSAGAIRVVLAAEQSVEIIQVLQLARIAATGRLQIDRSSLRLLSTQLRAPEVPWPEAVLQEFVRLLESGEGLIEVIDVLDAVGIFEQILPEWALVSSKPQRNAFHRYSVDRHLLEAVVGASKVRRRVHRPDLLVLAALLHDIGKGEVGDHTDNGVRMVGVIGHRMGMHSMDIDTLVRLTRCHLLLPETAMKRDVSDPATVERVAAEVGDTQTLELLFALTEADSQATGVLAWSTWKETLIGELVERSRAFLLGAEQPSSDLVLEDDIRDQLIVGGRAGCAVLVKDGILYVAAPDRPGLFSTVAGSLSLAGISIVSADVSSISGVAIECFRVSGWQGGNPNYQRFKSELSRFLTDPTGLPARLEERSASVRPRRPTMAASQQLPARVVVDNFASQRATVVEVWAPNRRGLLFELTSTIANAGYDIVHAKVMTLGDDVIDTFYITGPGGERIADEIRVSEIERELGRVAEHLSASSRG